MNNEIEREVRVTAMWCTVSNLMLPIGMWVDSPFSSFLVLFISSALVLLIWVTNREKHPFIDESAKQALNFTLSFALYIIIVTLAIVGLMMAWISKYLSNVDYLHSFPEFDFTFIGVGAIVSLIIPLLCLIHFIAIVYGTTRVIKGNVYKYPFTIRFFR
jgi:uncharacterized Tic20 family protein